MFTDTGNMSFWLSAFFIFVSFCGIFSVYLIAKNKYIEPDNLDKLIDLGKWFIVSVAITLSASIVNDGFKEREQDVKEMEVFDKYTPIILEADGIEKRKLLSEYFASVSPEGSIKTSWENYEAKVDAHIKELMVTGERLALLAEKVEKGTASNTEKVERLRLAERASALNQSLLPSSDIKPRIYFHIQKESQRIKAKALAKDIEMDADVVVPGVQRLDAGPSETELRYFKRSEEQEANRISSVISSLGIQNKAVYVKGYESSTSIRPRHYELWFSNAQWSE